MPARSFAAPRIVFLGSSDSVFSNRHFLALQAAGCEVAAAVDVPSDRRVSTNASGPQAESFVTRSAALGIPVLSPRNPNEPSVVDDIRRMGPDALIAVGYLLILKAQLLAVPRVAPFNFHASLLPAYRGKHPVFWALRNGEAWSGITIHVMSRGLDEGDIVLQRKVRTRRSDSVSALYDRIIDRSLSLVPRLVQCIRTGNVPRRPQGSRGTSIFGATTDEDFRLDWSLPARVLERRVRATPGRCFVEKGGRRLYVLDAEVWRGLRGKSAGTATLIGRGSCVVSTGDGSLVIHGMRDENGRTVGAAEALEVTG